MSGPTSTSLPAELQHLAAQNSGVSTSSLDFAKLLDAHDDLAPLRAHYHIPLKVAAQSSSWPQDKPAPVPSESEPALYLCGNSLGPLAARSRDLLRQEIDAWGTHSVLGHFNHPHGTERQWTKMDDVVNRLMADIVGAKPSEVTAMDTLTGNLHTVLATFYRPLAHPDGLLPSAPKTGKMRHKIIHEKGPFPSDQYALAAVCQLNNLDPATSLVPLDPRQGEDTLRTEDILATMEREAATGECWGVLLGGIQYLTGQLFEIEKIAAKGRQLGIMVGIDLAHGFANVPLSLHDWGVDFAVWCTYKYGSSGPGGIAGLFIHEKWFKDSDGDGGAALVRPAGWWGHKRATRFAMPPTFDPSYGAPGWQTSNPSMLDVASLRGSLETLAAAVPLTGAAAAAAAAGKTKTGAPLTIGPSPLASDEHASARESPSAPLGAGSIMPVLRAKSLKLTGYLEHLLFEVPSNSAVFSRAGMHLVTPRDPAQRGSQLSIRIPNVDVEAPAPAPAPVATSTSGAPGPDGPGGAPVPPPISKSTLVARIHTHAEETYGLIADIRNPDIIRLAPLAQYSSFEDVWRAAEALRESVVAVIGAQAQ